MKRLWLILFLSSFIFSQNWATEINKKYSPAVTSIEIIQINGDKSFGSGFNVDKGGLIVTNYHVVKSAKEIFVKFKGGDRYKVEYFTYVDEDKDFAILKIAGFELPIIKLGNSDKVEIGNEIVAIGHPEGAGYSMTDGMISQIRRNKTLKLLQISAYIGPGSSGGPLFNYNQEVIGVTTSGLENTSINFAIPINYIRGAMNASNNASKKKVGYDIKEKTISNKRRDWSPPARASGDIYNPRTPVYKQKKKQLYTFGLSYYLGGKDFYPSPPTSLLIQDKFRPNGWSVGFGFYRELDNFGFLLININYLHRNFALAWKVDHLNNPGGENDYAKVYDYDFSFEGGLAIYRKVFASLGYGISINKSAKKYPYDEAINAQSSPNGNILNNYLMDNKNGKGDKANLHRVFISINYQFTRAMIKLEYLYGLTSITYFPYTGEIDTINPNNMMPHRGIRLRLEIPIKGKYY